MSAGARVGWVGGKTKSRDHFPIRKDFNTFTEQFIIGGEYLVEDLLVDEENPIGDGTAYPWGLSLETMMEWFSRVRQWQCEISGNFAYGAPNDPPGGMFHWETDGTFHVTFKYKHAVSVYNYAEGHPDDNGYEPTKEYEAVMYRGFQSARIIDGDVVAGSSVPTTEIQVSDIEWDISPDNFPVSQVNIEHYVSGNFDGTDLWPRFVLLFQVANEFGSGSHVCRTLLFFNEDFPPSNTIIGNLTLITPSDTETTSIYLQYDGEDPSPHYEDQTRIDSIDVTISAVKFWPFANSQGQQVYDEDTGEQLVDPFS